MHRPRPATCCRRCVPGSGRGKLVWPKDAVTGVHLQQNRQSDDQDQDWFIDWIIVNSITRMSSSPVLSSQPRKVELLDSLASRKFRKSLTMAETELVNRRWCENNFHHQTYFLIYQSSVFCSLNICLKTSILFTRLMRLTQEVRTKFYLINFPCSKNLSEKWQAHVYVFIFTLSAPRLVQVSVVCKCNLRDHKFSHKNVKKWNMKCFFPFDHFVFLTC